MARVKRGVTTRRRHNRYMKAAKGYVSGHGRLIKTARASADNGWKYAYHARKQRNRQFRVLWIVRSNAAAREHGPSYSRMIHGLERAGVEIDRKVPADLAVSAPRAFGALAELARNPAG